MNLAALLPYVPISEPIYMYLSRMVDKTGVHLLKQIGQNTCCDCLTEVVLLRTHNMFIIKLDKKIYHRIMVKESNNIIGS